MNETCQINIRLLPTANRAIREFIHQRGDLLNHILKLFETVDLKTVKIPDMRAQREDGSRLASTVISAFPLKYHTQMQQIARKRGCTMSALLNGGVIEYSKMLRKQKRTKSADNN
jgi:DNA-binding NtrC family response regulator